MFYLDNEYWGNSWTWTFDIKTSSPESDYVFRSYNSKKIKTDTTSTTHKAAALSPTTDDEDFSTTNYCMVAIR